jgi:hypothetical protein
MNEPFYLEYTLTVLRVKDSSVVHRQRVYQAIALKKVVNIHGM